jgi:hypothetical protein
VRAVSIDGIVHSEDGADGHAVDQTALLGARHSVADSDARAGKGAVLVVR